jgi:DNA-binding Lrp family transcriptional regulator
MSMLDDLDRALLHALQLDARAPFSRIAAALDVSTQTVARRYRRLRTEAGLRVVGLATPHHAGRAQWMVRITAGPHTSQDVAHALARRDDTSWVRLTSGGTEIFAIISTPAGATNSHSLLLHDIPRTAGITSVSAHYVLHTYVGGPTAWRGRPEVLTAQQQSQLRQPGPTTSAHAVEPTDGALMAALSQDGRASLADLAAATGWAPATVSRRLADLESSGAIFFDLEVDPAVLGATIQAMLWMSVSPPHLDQVATTLAQHDELAFVAATTGPTNLVANALCPGPEALHQYLIHRLGALEAIRTLETAPVLRTVKATSPITTRRP